jgi:hypothetical protein
MLIRRNPIEVINQGITMYSEPGDTIHLDILYNYELKPNVIVHFPRMEIDLTDHLPDNYRSETDKGNFIGYESWLHYLQDGLLPTVLSFVKNSGRTFTHNIEKKTNQGK